MTNFYDREAGLPEDPNQAPRQIEDGSFVSVGSTVLAYGKPGVITKFGGDCVWVRREGLTHADEFDISEIEQTV